VGRPLAAGSDLGQAQSDGEGFENLLVCFQGRAFDRVCKGQQLAAREAVKLLALIIPAGSVGNRAKVSRFGFR
jgi:hypothetical protein